MSLPRHPNEATKPYPSEALTDIAKQLLDEWCLTPEEIGNLAMDLAGECERIEEGRNEAAWEAWSSRDCWDDSSYRRDMIAAGRGHLLKG